MFLQPDARQPGNQDIQAMLGDICANSDADVSFDRQSFVITGSDESVKDALMVIAQIKFAVHSPYQIRVKIELANEHKEFVSGKKNGKINKIMGHSNVQIMFDNFGEYNFNIEVIAQAYDSLKQGLTLVEQEMPASISFHVPDQYHKRIIGIGGQHIQRIMKKHSVFVKFSNAMDRGKSGLACMCRIISNAKRVKKVAWAARMTTAGSTMSFAAPRRAMPRIWSS